MNTLKENILIAGGTGLVGKRLLSAIDLDKYHVTVLTRSSLQSTKTGIIYAKWDPDNDIIDHIAPPTHIINLAGAGIAEERWTKKRKEILVSSRVKSAETIAHYLTKNKINPKTYISASAVGYYGDSGNNVLTENSKQGNEFLSDCCVQWEDAAHKVGILAEREVILRIGIVLSMNGGALPKMLMTKAIGIFNYFGNGNQYYPWIHIDDLCSMILYSMENTEIKGTYNAVAPQEMTNKQMVNVIKNSYPSFGLVLPAPAFALKILLGEMAAVILNSNRVSAEKWNKTDFEFEFSELKNAILDLNNRKV